VAQYAQSVLPMVQQNAMPAGAASAILKSALKPYLRYDRALEEEVNNLQGTMQQLQGLQQQLQQSQQQAQQTQQQLQQATQLIQMLQQQAAEAKAAREQADAALKAAQTEKVKAETREMYGETKDGALKPVKTAAEINELRERAESYSQRRVPPGAA
jgi:septal ring factor EnvC (AmiA/AmiB activator)